MFDWKAWLKPGDILLYKTPSTLGWFIRFKTWEDVNHCELYLGDGKSAAARGSSDSQGGGVNTFDLRVNGLTYVLRPNQPFDLAKMAAFHQTCIGQKYDSWGLVKIFYFGKDGNPTKAFCSEHVARMCRVENGGPGLFNTKYDCDKVSPGMLKSSAHGDLWSVKDVEDDSQVPRTVPGEARG